MRLNLININSKHLNSNNIITYITLDDIDNINDGIQQKELDTQVNI